MKRLMNLCLLGLVGLAWSGQSWYGPSGYSFIPDGFVDQGAKYGGYFAGEFVSLNNARLYPRFTALRWSGMSNRLELSLSSVYSFVNDNGYGPRKIGDGLLPVCPSVKWSVQDQKRTWVRWAFAVGGMAPYGAYGATTVRGLFPVLQPELTVVLASTLGTTYGLMGGRLRLADLSGKPLPLSLLGDAGWASSMKYLGETKEAFYSLGAEIEMGRNLVFSSVYRQDPREYRNVDTGLKLPSQNQDGRWSLKLEYRFDGVKQVEGGVQ